MRAIVAGDERAPISEALEDAGFDVASLDGVPTGERLEAADVSETTVLVLTDSALATAVPVAREANPSLRTVIYDERSPPDFVSGQLDLAVDPRLVDPAELADAITD